MIKEVELKIHGDRRGKLIALESNADIPFEVKRIYYIYDNIKDVRRGYHAHKNLKQFLVCVNGSCTIHLDNGTDCFEISLDKPDKGLYISGLIWREMYNFAPGTVLLVMASSEYDENDYIRSYKEFVKICNESSNQND